MLEEEEMIKTTELSEQLNVSVMTIRRDLNSLSKDGLVTLIHGGAALNRGALFEHNLLYKKETLNDEKRRIGEFCTRFVNEGDAIFIDTGSTALKIAEALVEKKNLLVMSHSLVAQQMLAHSKGIKLISTPGVFREKTYGFLGQLTCEFIKGFRIDTLFLGVEGVDIEHGFTVPDITDGETKRALVNQASQIVVVADYTKIGISYFMTIAPLNRVDILVTNENADPDIIKEIRAQGVTVYLV
jgi:DeoR/GlpR family transcriptional regulator of sugar metabolism